MQRLLTANLTVPEMVTNLIAPLESSKGHKETDPELNISLALADSTLDDARTLTMFTVIG